MEPFFLLGVERDSVALLTALIAAHPQLVWGGPVERVDARASHGALCDRPFRNAARAAGFAIRSDFARALRRWPTARFVFVGRSATRADAERAAERDWRRLAAEIPAGRRLEVRYERLVRDPRGECARLCEFLAVPFSTNLLREPLRQTSGGGPRATRSAWAALRDAGWLLEAWVKTYTRSFTKEPFASTWTTRSSAVSYPNLRATSDESPIASSRIARATRTPTTARGTSCDCSSDSCYRSLRCSSPARQPPPRSASPSPS